MSVPLIRFDRVTKRFHAVTALDGVSFDVRPGEFHALCGENGAGKSTLMKILSGVITDYEGRIELAGNVLALQGTREAESLGISIIHQELNLVGDLSVAANIFLGRELQTGFGLIDDRRMERESKRLFDQLDCRIDPQALVRTLRIGDQQLVEIAKALSLGAENGGSRAKTATNVPSVDHEPKVKKTARVVSSDSSSTRPSETDQTATNVNDPLSPGANHVDQPVAPVLIMDEPTSALTESEVERLFRIIGRLRTQGVTIVYISHKMDEIFQHADRITILRDGQVVKTLNRAETTPREVTHLMVGRAIEASDFGANRSAGEPVLHVEQLSLPWRGHVRQWRLKDVSLTVRRGEVVGVAGLMGAGRTELLECLFGASTEPPQGQITLDGQVVEFAHPEEALQAGIGLVTEDRKRYGIFSEMTVRDHITLSSLEQVASVGFVNAAQERKAADESISALRVKTAGREASIMSLSGGNQQKCIIARALRTRPKLLLLDDPTRGIDVGAKAEIYRLIDELCRQGLAIVITSSELPELITVCDRIMVLCEGRVTAEFQRPEFSEQKLMEAATTLAT